MSLSETFAMTHSLCWIQIAFCGFDVLEMNVVVKLKKAGAYLKGENEY